MRNNRKYSLFSITTACLLVIIIPAKAQVKSLFVNSYSNIVRLNSTTSPAAIDYTGIKDGFEAIAHAEDSKGNILFFVNANGVYTSKGELMPNSQDILANPSSAEIDICPFPGNPNKYYIFYNAELCSPLYYSIIDMKLNKGLGDVSSLNVLLDSMNVGEGLELVKRPCTNSFWLLAYECDKGFKRYTVDENGISSGVLIYSHAGPSIYLGRGELDYHNGRLGKAFSNSPIPLVFLCDFDPLSGTVCNPRNIELPPGGNGVYGMEFSPDGTKAYMTEWYNMIKNNLFQYNFETGKLSSYSITSKQADTSRAVTGPGQIELGADGKLYIPFDGGSQITVIDNPNSASPVFSKINTTSILALGVSDHIQSEILKASNNFTFEHVCLSETTRFRFKPSDCTASKAKLTWNFGDQESKKKNNSTELSPVHIYSKPGDYIVTLYVSDGIINDTITHLVTISAYPKVNLGKDTAVCPGRSITLDAGDGGKHYSWSTAAYDRKIKVASAGKYWVNVTDNGCASSDTIAVSSLPKPSLNLGDDVWLCDKKSYELNAGTGAKSYLWSTGETASKIKITENGTYSVKVSNGMCTSLDTMDAVFQKSPVVYLGTDTALCSPGSIELDAGNTGDYYFWATGETTQKIIARRTGTYAVTVGKGTCTVKDEINVTISDFKPFISMPQSFRPDAKTPFLKVDAENIEKFHIKIYGSKTSQLVFESSDILKSWDGRTSNSAEAEKGVYKYTIEYSSKCNVSMQLKQGTFELLR